MAAVETGAREELSRPEMPRASPRCEAFVMTGDKILNLDHHVSPSYAKVAKEQLPPSTQIQETPRRTPLSDFPSVRRSTRSRLPVSTSQPDSVRRTPLLSCEEPENVPESSRVTETVNPDVPEKQLESPSSDTVTSEDKNPSSSPSILPSPPEEISQPPMISSMHSSYYKSAFSNPQLHIHNRERNGSSDTFVVSTADSPSKHSTVTVNATTSNPLTGGPSSVTSPSFRRILANSRATNGCSDRYGSFRSDVSSYAGATREEREAVRLAAKLYKLEEFTKADVAERLDDPGEFASLVATKYLELFSFGGLRIDAALRSFLSRVELCGETSQRERLLRFFSARYHATNPSLFSSVDDVHTLTCALLLLNSDLHGANVGKRMSVRDFINNIGHTGVQIKRDLLKALYNAIKDNAISNDNSPAGKGVHRPLAQQMLLEVDPESQVEYKSGWLMRKCVYDSDGAKTPMGRRGWRMWFARLRGFVLYLQRDEGDAKTNKFTLFNNAILLHHSFAEAAQDYKKRNHIFRLRTAELGEFLFQTSSASDVEEWVSQLNFVSAAFSSRSLPPPAGSQTNFVRSRLPKLPSQAPLSEQLKAHEAAANELRTQLSVVQEGAPPLKARGRVVEEFFFKERYLSQEIARYDEYIRLLQNRLGGEGSDSTSGVHSKSDIADDEKISYKEAVQR